MVMWIHDPWASYQIRKIAGAHAPGMPGKFSPPPRSSDPGMHHGTCVTHVPWCMPGSLTNYFLWSRRRGKTFPAFPAHAQTAILRIGQEAHCDWGNSNMFRQSSHKRMIPANVSQPTVPTGSISNKQALFWILAWHRVGDKQFTEPLIAQLTDAYVRHPISMSLEQGRHFADDDSHAFSWMETILFWFKFRWNLFIGVQFAISQH